MLAQIIVLLSRMGYTELKDFIDYCEFYHLAELMKPSPEKYQFRKLIRGRRMGIASGGLPYPEWDGGLDPSITFKGLELTTDTQDEAHTILVKLTKQDLISLLGATSANRNTGGAIAWALLWEKEPVRRLAKGNIQVKWIEIYKTVVQDELGNEVATSVKSPYLYFRYWTVQGNSNRKETRYKSVYIGPESKTRSRRKGGYPYKPLAQLLDNLIQEHGIPKSWTDPRTGETKIDKIRPKGANNPVAKLERMILRHVDLSSGEAEINHQRLERLQELLCRQEG